MINVFSKLIGGLRLFAWFTLRHQRRHWLRTLAVLLGIALGAAVFTSVRLAVQATLAAYTGSMTRIAGSSDATVLRPGGRVPDTLVADLQRQPAIQTASPVLSTYVRPAGQEAPFLLLGFDPVLDRDLRRWRTDNPDAEQMSAWAALMTRPNSMLIGAGLSAAFGWRAGQSVELLHSHGTAAFTVLSVLQAKGLALVEGGQADWIDLRLAPGAPVGALAAIAKRLPPGVVLQPPSARSESGRGMIRAYQLSLTFLSFVSLFVGMFLVYSLVALNAAHRRRELAVLRATGASGRLLFALFLGEGAFIGLSGWLLALPISGLIVRHLLTAVSRTVSLLFVRVQVDGLVLAPWELLLSFSVTLAVAVLAALQPARGAMRVPPREALDIVPMATLRPHTIRRLSLGGGLLLALVFPISLLPSPPSVSLPGYLAALLLFVGFALLAPLLLEQFGRLLGPHLTRLGGQPAVLAAGYLRQSGVQTAISVGALITAVALYTSLVIMVHSFRSTTVLWVDQSIAGDLYIRPKLAELNRFRDPLPPRAVAALKALSAPVTLVPTRRLELRWHGYPHLFQALDVAAYLRHNRFIWMGGDAQQIEKDLIAGRGVAVSEVFANRTGLGIGDRYQVRIGGRLLDEPILGIFRDYRTRGGAVCYSLARYQARFGDPARSGPDWNGPVWSGVQVDVSEKADDPASVLNRVRTKLMECCGASVEMIQGSDLRRVIVEIFDQTFAITTVLLLIALTVAAIGTATNLAVRVLQRRRQLSTLVAVGASTRQLRRMIFWEAGLIVTVGEAAGVACGFLLSILLIFVVNRQSFGWTFLYRVDTSALLIALPLIFAASLLAAVPAVNLALSSSPAALLRGGTP
ncbi:MAG: ABC transporter permease [Desulfosarcinaceae bacterium]